MAQVRTRALNLCIDRQISGFCPNDYSREAGLKRTFSKHLLPTWCAHVDAESANLYIKPG